jgi:hypothetical protein
MLVDSLFGLRLIVVMAVTGLGVLLAKKIYYFHLSDKGAQLGFNSSEKKSVKGKKENGKRLQDDFWERLGG